MILLHNVNHWVKFFLVGCLGGFSISGAHALVCDAFDQCLSAQEERTFSEALTEFRQGDKNLAVTLLGEIYHESSTNQLLANNYAVMLAAVGRVEEASYVLEEYLLNESHVSAVTSNLLTSYLNHSLTGTGAEDQAQSLVLIDPSRREDRPAGDTNDAVFTVDNAAELGDNVSAGVASAGAPIPRSGVDTVLDDIDLVTVQARLIAFTKAWSSGAVNDYLSFYVPLNSPVKNLSYEVWLKQRQARVSAGRQISVSAVDIDAYRQGDEIITDYTQYYYANNYQDSSAKRLVWALAGGQWQIKEEISR